LKLIETNQVIVMLPIVAIISGKVKNPVIEIDQIMRVVTAQSAAIRSILIGFNQNIAIIC
jgi:hypothetical protein